MAIEVNGVSLPDIPEDVLEQYPYVIIFSTDYTSGGEAYTLFQMYASTIEWKYLDMAQIGDTGQFISTEGAGVYYGYADTMGYWEGFEQYEKYELLDLLALEELNSLRIALVWANHDIYEVTGIDEANMKLITGSNVFFSDSTVVYEDEYCAPSTWFVDMAKQVRRFTGVGKKLTTDAMLQSLENAPISWMLDTMKEITGSSSNYQITSDVEEVDPWPFTLADVVIGTELHFPKAKSIGFGAFYKTTVSVVDFPVAERIGDLSFAENGMLTEVCFPAATTIGYRAFRLCSSLTKADFPLAESFGQQCFQSATKLATLIIRTPGKVCALYDTSVLDNTLIESGTGYVYVPSALVDSYKADTNWSTYAAQIRAIEDYPDICGTT